MSDKVSIERLREEVENLEPGAGLSMTGVLGLPTSLGQLVKWLIRMKVVKLGELAAYIGEEESTTHSLLTALIEKGLLEETLVDGETCYRAHIVSHHKPTVSRNLWKILE